MEGDSEAECEVPADGSPDEAREQEFPYDGEIPAGEQYSGGHGDKFAEWVGVVPVTEHPVSHLFAAEVGGCLNFGDGCAEVDVSEEELYEACGPDGEGWRDGGGVSLFPAIEEGVYGPDGTALGEGEDEEDMRCDDGVFCHCPDGIEEVEIDIKRGADQERSSGSEAEDGGDK